MRVRRSDLAFGIIATVALTSCGPRQTAAESTPTPVSSADPTPIPALERALTRSCGASRPPAAPAEIIALSPTAADDFARLKRAIVDGPGSDLIARVTAVAEFRHAAWARLLADPDSGLSAEERAIIAAIDLGTAVREAQVNFALTYRTRAVHQLGAIHTPAARDELILIRDRPDADPRLRRTAERALTASPSLDDL